MCKHYASACDMLAERARSLAKMLLYYIGYSCDLKYTNPDMGAHV